MDKFGILNLLNSFLNFSGEQTKPKEDEKKETPTTIAEKRANSVPIQYSMLKTLSSHDAFIKRVMEKNKKNQ